MSHYPTYLIAAPNRLSLGAQATACILAILVGSLLSTQGQANPTPAKWHPGTGEHRSRVQDNGEEIAPTQPGDNTGLGTNLEPGTAVTSSAGLGLTITPTFDSSILNNSKSAAIQSTINQAVSILESLFSDPIDVKILFRYSNTLPGGTPIGTDIARSNFVIYHIPWSTYITSLKADEKTHTDMTANATLPATSLSSEIIPSSAGGRAVGLDTPPAMFADGSVGSGGPYDGIVTLNSDQPLQFTRPPTSSNYDALRATEHEMDEVLGLGSHLNATPPSANLRPQDLFSWSSSGMRNTTAVGSRYFSITSGGFVIVSFNQDSSGDFGDWLSGFCPAATPYVQNAFGCKGQASDVTSTSPEGVNLDVIGYDLGPAPVATTLANISTRLQVQAGDSVLIGGFIITGTQPKKVILRAIGPSLADAVPPIAGALANPTLELHDATGALLDANDDWVNAPDKQAIIDSTIPPTNDLESAIVATLPANGASYTAIVSGVNNTTGIALVEAYDLDSSVDSKLANISTRGFVATGENVMIAGTIVHGQASQTVLIRAIGPSLANAVPPVTDALADPTLELHDANGTLIQSNDNWRSDQEAEIIATGAPPNDDLESALIATLPANDAGYTAIVGGVTNTTGVALVEIYALQ